MPYRDRRRVGVTLAEVLVVLTILGVLIAMLLPAVQAARARSNRIQCGDNLRQLGLGVHNYHDVNGAIPPLYSEAVSDTGEITSKDAPSWAVFLLPWMERRAEWEQLVIGASVTNDTFTLPGGAGQTNRNNMSSVRCSTFNCPTRGRRTVSLAGRQWQTSDYAPTVTSVITNSAGAPQVWDGQRASWTGMIVPPLRNATECRGLVSRTTFGSVTDGLSFTAMFGEKHMGQDWLGSKSLDYPVMPFRANYRSIRTTGLPLTKSPREGTGGSTVPARMRFGSWHPGYTQFCFGDTSIKRVKNFTSVKRLIEITGRADSYSWGLP